MPDFYFIPGPSQLYFTVEGHIRNVLKDGIPSISHRSSDFQKIYQRATEAVRSLLSLPGDYEILFTSSATEIWERTIQNLVEKETYHLVNGAFSSRFHAISHELGRNALSANAPEGKLISPKSLLIPETTELIALTHNETSTGVMQPVSDITEIRNAFPNQLLALDVVSSVPDAQIDYSQVDTAYFSVQKGFGLPAGLGVWLLNQRCIDIAEERAANGKHIGTYHSIPSLLEKSAKNQTPETPNVLGIYLLACVAEDMLNKGLDQIRREIAYKSAVLYQVYENHPGLKPFVEIQEHRSRTTTVASVGSGSASLIAHLKEKGFVIGSGYGKFKQDHIRIANFPTHSREQIEMLSDLIARWEV